MDKELHEITEEERVLLHDCLLHMLIDIIAICNKHNITYMLGGGTALGAVRHKGFIPWDDDIDLVMPRADYNHFVEIMREELGDNYEFTVPHSEQVEIAFLKIYKKGTVYEVPHDDAPYPYVWIDVFPLEYAPNDVFVRYIKGITSDALHFLAASLFIARTRNELTHKSYGRNWGRRIRYWLAILLGYLFFFVQPQDVYNLCDSFDRHDENTAYVTIPTGRAHYLGECLPLGTVYPLGQAEFCGLKVNVYNDMDRYLRALYGDYMQIPPPEKREQHYLTFFSVEDNISWNTPKRTTEERSV